MAGTYPVPVTIEPEKCPHPVIENTGFCPTCGSANAKRKATP